MLTTKKRYIFQYGLCLNCAEILETLLNDPLIISELRRKVKMKNEKLKLKKLKLKKLKVKIFFKCKKFRNFYKVRTFRQTYISASSVTYKQTNIHTN